MEWVKGMKGEIEIWNLFLDLAPTWDLNSYYVIQGNKGDPTAKFPLLLFYALSQSCFFDPPPPSLINFIKSLFIQLNPHLFKETLTVFSSEQDRVMPILQQYPVNGH